MQGRWRHLGALVMVVAAAALAVSGCPKQSQPVENNAATTSSRFHRPFRVR